MSATEQQCPENILEQLRLGRRFARTRTSDIYEASQSGTKKEILFARATLPVAPLSQEAFSFTQRLHSLVATRAAIPNVLHFGVDRQGTAYLLMERQPLRPLFGPSRTAEEMSFVFQQILRTFSAVQKKNIFFGDLCDYSFFLNKRGQVLLVSLLGSVDTIFSGVPNACSDETYCYLAPEQRNGEPGGSASDFYALGVYALRMSTQILVPAFDDEEEHRQFLQTYLPHYLRSYPLRPAWLEQFLAFTLAWSPDQRCSSPNDLKKLIKRRNYAVSCAPTLEDELDVIKQRKRALSAWQYLLGGLIGALFLLLAFWFFSIMVPRQRYNGQEQFASISSLFTSPQLMDETTSAEQQSAPAPDSFTGGNWDFHLGKGSYSEEEWLTNNLRAIDEKKSTESTAAARWLSKAYSSSSKPEGTASSVKDSSAGNPKQAATAAVPVTGLARYSSRQEIERTLRFSSRYSKEAVLEAAENAELRGMYSSYNQIFLRILMDFEQPSPAVIAALARATVGQIAPEDVEVFAADQSFMGELALLAAAADSSNADVLAAVAGKLSVRQLVTEPGASIINALKQQNALLPVLIKSAAISALSQFADNPSANGAALTQLMPFIYRSLPQILTLKGTNEAGQWCPLGPGKSQASGFSS